MRIEREPLYVRPWPLGGELGALVFAAVMYVLGVALVLLLLTGCRPFLQEPKPPSMDEPTISCYDFTQTDPAKREFPCPSPTGE